MPTAPSYVGASIRTVESAVGADTRAAPSYVGAADRRDCDPIFFGEYGFTNVLDAGESVPDVASAEVRYRSPCGAAGSGSILDVWEDIWDDIWDDVWGDSSAVSAYTVTGHDGSTQFWSHLVQSGTFDCVGTWQAQLVLTLASGLEIKRRSRFDVRPVLTPFIPTGVLGLFDGSVLGPSETDAVGVES